jgi:hypothetical protein
MEKQQVTNEEEEEEEEAKRGVRCMVLRTNGDAEEMWLAALEDFQGQVDGNVEMLMRKKPHFYLPDTFEKSGALDAYVNEEGMMRRLASNPWAAFLSVLGFRFGGFPLVFGNVVLFGGFDESGSEQSLDERVVALIREAKRLDDACADDDALDKFYCALETAQLPSVRAKGRPSAAADAAPNNNNNNEDKSERKSVTSAKRDAVEPPEASPSPPKKCKLSGSSEDV